MHLIAIHSGKDDQRQQHFNADAAFGRAKSDAEENASDAMLMHTL